jgi:hypothetical protein
MKENRPRIIYVDLPGHKQGAAPDHVLVGKKLDNVLRQNFPGKDLVIRCIGSQDHPDISSDKLADIIVKTGTDKYDKGRLGVGYEEFVRKGVEVDFYGEEVSVTENMDFMPQQIWEMHHSAIGDRGYGVHVDLVLIYDANKLDMVMNLYDFHSTSDGYTFKNPTEKSGALLGVFKIN